MSRLALWCALVVLLPGLSQAFKYNSIVTPPVHEALTMLAEACVASTAERAELDCHEPDAPLRARWRALERARRKARDVRARFTPLARATRWPDNPEHRTGPGLLAALARCEKARRRESHPAAGPHPLTCESHYLRLQFMHAMASVLSDADGAPLPAQDLASEPVRVEGWDHSRTLILDWMATTFAIASGEVEGRVAMVDAARGPALARRLSEALPEGTTVADFFGESDAAALRDLATGALLHVIQDSFSSAHVRRTDERPHGGFPAEMRCGEARDCYEYFDGYGQEEHAKADGWPRAAPDCASGAAIADPVTASAEAIRRVRTARSATPSDRQQARDAFRAYAEGHVLGMP